MQGSFRFEGVRPLCMHLQAGRAWSLLCTHTMVQQAVISAHLEPDIVFVATGSPALHTALLRPHVALLPGDQYIGLSTSILSSHRQLDLGAVSQKGFA